MKKFMQILLATFGVMALVFAGCSKTEEAADDAAMDGEEEAVVEDDSMMGEEMPAADEEADMEEAE